MIDERVAFLRQRMKRYALRLDAASRMLSGYADSLEEDWPASVREPFDIIRIIFDMALRSGLPVHMNDLYARLADVREGRNQEPLNPEPKSGDLLVVPTADGSSGGPG